MVATKHADGHVFAGAAWQRGSEAALRYLNSEAAVTASKAALGAMLVSLFGYLPGGVTLYGSYAARYTYAGVHARVP